MKQGKYENLRNIYPEYISKVQLYQICGVSPRSAQYLLQNGIIPSIDTGKTTWRYKIALTDVITYLRKREQVGSMIPCGAVSPRHKRPDNSRKAFSVYVSRGLENEMAEYFKFIFADCPDTLSATGAAEILGVTKETVLHNLKRGHLKSLGIGNNNNYIIPKQHVIEFACSPKYFNCKSNSETFKKIIGGFEIWLTVK